MKAKKIKTLGVKYGFAVTGTYHGSIIKTYSEGQARKIFHNFYNGESILNVLPLGYGCLIVE